MRPLMMALTLLAFGSACAGSAHADRIASPPVLTTDPSPYSIELVSEGGALLDTYQHRGRFYVQGNTGERYSIRVSNPTDQRVEAVISVDGLDVVDGETANFASKRGYIVPARGNVNIDGFRVSTQNVAAFRFSSVSASYAARKGKARNVGVVGVAIFAERPQEVLAIPTPFVYRDSENRSQDYRDDGYREERTRGAHKSAAPTRSSHDRPSAEAGASVSSSDSARGHGPADPYQPAPTVKRERPGLGTEFGEQRYSAVQFTTFVRANSKKPTAIAELRYNDRDGLQALGITLRQPPTYPDHDELLLRETASSFPDSRFAQPPR